ncbi:MAG: SPOR domain-containing protein [Sphingomicrobium sp.]
MIHRHLLFAALVACCACPLAAQSVRAGIDAWQKSDYPAAVTIWRPLAEAGDSDAQFNLGQAYRLGRGVTLNLAVAKTWFERAAASGHVDAQTTLGLLLFQNGEQSEGLKWLGKAAEHGEARAMLIYGTALVNGDTVTQDPVMGYAFVSRAAAQGLGAAKETLAQLDEILPLADRKKGVALAKAKARSSPPPGSKPARTATAKAKPVKPAQPAKSIDIAAAEPIKAKPEAAKAPAPSTAAKATSGNWRVQLGAFGQKGAAQALYAKVAGALGGRKAYYLPAGAVTRLQVGPYASKAEASAACGRLKGQACFPVAAK